jgi:hypothetical protein
MGKHKRSEMVSLQGSVRRPPHLHTCMYVCMHVCMHAFMYVCRPMYVCMYVYMYVCVYISGFLKLEDIK